jgi:integrase
MGLWKDKGRGDWRYSFEHQKKTYAGGGFQTKAQARTAREERRKQVKTEESEKEKTLTAFSGIAKTYLDYSQKKHAKKTYEYKAMVAAHFIGFLQAHGHGDPDIAEITPQILHEYLNTRPSRHNYNAHRKELCTVFSYAIEKIKVLAHSPCWNLDRMPEEKKRKEIPSVEEFMRIVAAAPRDVQPLLVILTHSLARIDEILRLTWKDVNFELKTITLWTRKRKDGNWEPRHIPMNEDLFNVLHPMWKRREQEEWVFWNKKEKNRYNRRPKLMRSICKRAGTSHYGFHAIRHFSATYMHDVLKVPTGVLSYLLGHKNKATTEIYLHSVPESARDAMQRMEGFFDRNMLADSACGLEGKGPQLTVVNGSKRREN